MLKIKRNHDSNLWNVQNWETVFLIHPVYRLKICLLNLNIFRNEEVVILGASFSGADIGLDLVKSASKVYISFSRADIGLDLVKSDSKVYISFSGADIGLDLVKSASKA